MWATPHRSLDRRTWQNLITCLDVAESVAKLVPVFGDVLEGACGILRKTVQAAETARKSTPRSWTYALAWTTQIAFNIRSDISTTRLLTDLTNMQIRLESRMEDICKGQKTTHRMLRTILVEVRGRRTGGAYIKEAD
ncbi:hypothetical protein CPB85DRAFT_1568166 [Mucidula mucida]|nr:hypothetical protein CPB85DRAFT_1568166 [Mucidula mucida]